MTGPRGDFNNYQAIRSAIGKQAWAAGEGTPEASAYKAIRDAFDAAASRSLEKQGADPAMLEVARNAYQIQRLLRKAEVSGADESVTYNLQKAASAISDAIKNKTISNLPQDSQEALRAMMVAARAIKPVSTSGTAENQLARQIATAGMLGGGLEAWQGDKLGHIPGMVAGAVAAPYLLNKGIQAYGRGLAPELAAQIPDWASMTLKQLASGIPIAGIPW